MDNRLYSAMHSIRNIFRYKAVVAGLGVLLILFSASLLNVVLSSESANALTFKECEAVGGKWEQGTYPDEYCNLDRDAAACKALGGTPTDTGNTNGSFTCVGAKKPDPVVDESKTTTGAECAAAGFNGAAGDACFDGASNKTDFTYCTTKYASDAAALKACLAGQSNDALPECNDLGYTSGEALTACLNGSKNKSNNAYCATTYPGPDTPDVNAEKKAAALRKACEGGQNVSATPSNISAPVMTTPGAAADCEADPNAEGCEAEDKNTCKIDGVGWILCPVVNFIGQITDGMYDVMQGTLLAVQPSMFDRSKEGGKVLYDVWSFIRNIANVVFVIGFMVIIYSQVTSLGISNYGVKKLLPRLIIAAILVNVSFIVCAVAIDLSNIIGSSLKGMLDTLSNRVVSYDEANDAFGVFKDAASGKSVLANMFGVVLAGGAGVAATAAIAPSLPALLALIMPIALSALLAILLTVAVLTLRQALVVMLVIISPLAFVALLLPNTENWFKRWRSLFMTLLMMFPVIAFIFGAAGITGKIIMYTAPEGNLFLQIVGAGIQIIPLFLTPLLMKVSGGLLNRFAGLVNNKNKGLFDRVGNASKKHLETERKRADANILNGRGKYNFGRNAWTRYRTRRSAATNAADTGLKAAEAGFEISDNKTAGYVTDAANSQLGISAAGLAKNRMIMNNLDEQAIRDSLGTAALDSDVEEAIQSQISKAKIEEVKIEKVAIEKLVAETRANGGDTDKLLSDIAKDAGASSARKSAALDALASTGRDGALRQLANHATTTNDADMQASIQDAITSNAGALVGKAPDLVKGGADRAFKDIKANEITKLSDDAMDSYMSYLQTAGADANQNFVNALETISTDSTFKGDMRTGAIRKIVTGSAQNTAINAAVASRIDTVNNKFN